VVSPGARLWQRRAFLSGQAVSLLGDGLAVLAVPLLVLDLSRNPLVSALSAASLTLFLAVDPLGVVIAGTATTALGGDPRPVFLAAGVVVVATAAAGWLACAGLGMMEAVAAAPSQPAEQAGRDPFEEWDGPLAYTEAKSDLILDLVDQAGRWAADRHWPG
jgi:hypothetical protein